MSEIGYSSVEKWILSEFRKKRNIFFLKNILSEILQLRHKIDLYFNIICEQPADVYKALYVLHQEFQLDSGFVRSKCFSNAGVSKCEFYFGATESCKERLSGRSIRKALRFAGKATVSQRWNIPEDVADVAT